ncbi:hypothetical protein P7K49_038261 [Saguinus oedipus]|uniref:Uncharacterized protein n=1 Tax=Saguinus oedipus TaxID=9490 RepID=A0ABQ9TEH0_SAGOE|nr:hypothetical protein P7K49_038261 [Saguinus oedipus]
MLSCVSCAACSLALSLSAAMLEARLSAAAVAGSARAPDATVPSTAGVGCLRSAAAVDALVRGAMVEKSLRGEQRAPSGPTELCAAPGAASQPLVAVAAEGHGTHETRGTDEVGRGGEDPVQIFPEGPGPGPQSGVETPRPTAQYVDSVVSLKRTVYSKARGCNDTIFQERMRREERRAKEGKVDGGRGEKKKTEKVGFQLPRPTQQALRSSSGSSARDFLRPGETGLARRPPGPPAPPQPPFCVGLSDPRPAGARGLGLKGDCLLISARWAGVTSQQLHVPAR